MTDMEALRWVDEDQQRQLADTGRSAWGDEWPEYLTRYLDHTWSGWQQESDESRHEWLRDRIDSIGLGWVSADQRTQLDTLTATRGDWLEWLPRHLDTVWPGWSKVSPGDLGGWFADTLPSLLAQPETVTEDVRTLNWVTAEQRAALEALTPARGDWHDWLPGQLDQWWPAWADATAETLAPWLDGHLPSLRPAQPPGADPRSLSWLTVEHRAGLEALTPARGDWHDWLPGQLDQWWPTWTDATHEQLVGWFDTTLANLAPAPPADPRALGWLTDGQLEQLAELTDIRGDHRDWLPADLDRRRPGWTRLSPDELVEWFDDLLPFLILPDPEDELTDEEFDQYFVVREGEPPRPDAWPTVKRALDSGDLKIA